MQELFIKGLLLLRREELFLNSFVVSNKLSTLPFFVSSNVSVDLFVLNIFIIGVSICFLNKDIVSPLLKTGSVIFTSSLLTSGTSFFIVSQTFKR